MNCLARKTIKEITDRWEGLTEYHQGKAKTQLKGVPEALREIAADPPPTPWKGQWTAGIGE